VVGAATEGAGEAIRVDVGGGEHAREVVGVRERTSERVVLLAAAGDHGLDHEVRAGGPRRLGHGRPRRGHGAHAEDRPGTAEGHLRDVEVDHAQRAAPARRGRDVEDAITGRRGRGAHALGARRVAGEDAHVRRGVAAVEGAGVRVVARARRRGRLATEFDGAGLDAVAEVAVVAVGVCRAVRGGEAARRGRAALAGRAARVDGRVSAGVVHAAGVDRASEGVVTVGVRSAARRRGAARGGVARGRIAGRSRARVRAARVDGHVTAHAAHAAGVEGAARAVVAVRVAGAARHVDAAAPDLAGLGRSAQLVQGRVRAHAADAAGVDRAREAVVALRVGRAGRTGPRVSARGTAVAAASGQGEGHEGGRREKQCLSHQ